MPHDPVRVEDTRQWLAKVAIDIRTAEVSLAASPPVVESVVFHCQQAAEKALKAFLIWHDVPFRKTHSIEEIGEACLAIDGTLRDLINRAVPLTEYAWRYRYPSFPEPPSEEETEWALAIAREVRDAVLSRLPDDVQPDED
jgi:HEPN domain-containing protein